jgi:hypothetical protein
MLISIANILSKAPRAFWIILSISISVSGITTSVGFAAILFRASSFVYKNNNVEISLDRAQKIAENSQDLNQKIIELEAQIDRIKDKNLKSEIDGSIAEIKPAIKQVQKDSEKLIN